jgi:GNAT superfamily N-acetyltransferase
MKCKWEMPARMKSRIRAFKELRSRFGTARTLQFAIFRQINKFFYFDCLHIIILNRENLRPLDPAMTARISAKIATREEIVEMEKQACWGLPPKALEYFDRGDTCLLSYVDNKLAGYTWALKSECPTLVEGLTVSAPHEYLYNFCGFTHPDYRGYGLQSFRHHALLNHQRWKDRKGLLGFVVHTNRSSKRGQQKSGYRTIGKIYIIGTKSKVFTYIGKSLRNMGIKRINNAPSKQIIQGWQ